jgi:hypothetical protein
VINEFDDDEKDAVSSTDSIGRHQIVIFLTELGLYRLLGRKGCRFHRIQTVVSGLHPLLDGVADAESQDARINVSAPTMFMSHDVSATRKAHRVYRRFVETFYE